MGVLADGGFYLLANTALQNFSLFQITIDCFLALTYDGACLVSGFIWRLCSPGTAADLQRSFAAQIGSAGLQRIFAAQTCSADLQICSADVQRRFAALQEIKCATKMRICSADFGLDPHPQGQNPHLLQISRPFS